MAMVAWPWVDAEHPIHAADRAADRAADNTANWASGGTAFRRAALHSSENALSMNRDRGGEQSRNHGHSEFLPHCLFLHAVHDCPANPRPSAEVPSLGETFSFAGRLKSFLDDAADSGTFGARGHATWPRGNIAAAAAFGLESLSNPAGWPNGGPPN